MTFSNGRLPNSVLAPIPGGRLAKEPAAAWNAMLAEARRRHLPLPMPDGSDSTYRSYDRQVYWKNYWCGQGHCENAAEPGTSHHGEGIAVDCSVQNHNGTIVLIGKRYGWSKEWSDAPWEPWHHTYRFGIWTPPRVLDLKVGDHGVLIWVLSARLRIIGLLRDKSGVFGPRVHGAVVKFQRENHLTPDGQVGVKTWSAIKNAAEHQLKHHGGRK